MVASGLDGAAAGTISMMTVHAINRASLQFARRDSRKCWTFQKMHLLDEWSQAFFNAPVKDLGHFISSSCNMFR